MTAAISREVVEARIARERVALADAIGELRTRARGGQVAEIDTQARRVVQDQPIVAVGAALAFGYLLGRLLARRG